MSRPAPAARRHLAGRRRVRLAATVVAGLLLGLLPATAAAQEPGTLRIEPGSTTVDGGEAFTVEVIQGAKVPTTGAQITLVFDRSLVEVVDVKPGDVYTSAGALFLYGRTDDGTSASVEALVADANKTGVLKNVATFLLPGSGAVPPGEATFLTISLRGKYGEGGSNPLSVQAFTMLDEVGTELDVATDDGEVTVNATVAPSGLESPTPLPSASAAAETPAPTSGPAEVYVAPTSLQLTAGNPARIVLVANTAGAVSSIVADLAFDPQLVEVIGLEAGPVWTDASVIAGGSGQAVEQAIADANTTGVLAQAGVFLLPNAPELPSGEAVFLSVLVRGRADGTSSLALSNPTVLDPQGVSVPIASPSLAPGQSPGASGGAGGAGGGGAGSVDPLLVGVAVAIAAIVALAAVLRSGVIPERRRRRWPFYAALALAMIPVAMFAGLVLMIAVNAASVVTNPGLAALFSTKFSSQFSLGGITGDWGLVPAAYGTILITGIAIAIALPVSLAMAVIAAEFPMGPLGRLLRPVLGVLSGVPPIVYAVTAVVFVTLFVAPKFAGAANVNDFDPARIGADPATWPPADVPWYPTAFPWPPNVGGIPSSTLLGGFLIALLVIPFMTPLIYDAMRNVPSAAREASFALGANRSYTLRRVVVPQALPGIVAAVALATLKGLGDVLIVALAVGWQAETIPNPVFDVLERTGNLAATGANLLGNLQTGAGRYCDPKLPACAVGYSSALLLLVAAAAVVITATLLERWLRRRLHA